MNKILLLPLIAVFCISAHATEFQYKTKDVEISNINQKPIHLMSPIKIHNDELIVPIESSKFSKTSKHDKNNLWEDIKSYYKNDKVIEKTNYKDIGEFILQKSNDSTDLQLISLDKNKATLLKNTLLSDFVLMDSKERVKFGLDNFHGDIIINRYIVNENQQKIIVNKVILFYPNGIKFLTFMSNEKNTKFLIITPNDTNFEYMKSNIDKIIQYAMK